MKFNLRQTICTFGSAVAITAFFSNAAYAIQRTCNGAYEAEYKTASGQTGKLVFGGFEATRGCGRAVPNRCRDRARNALLKCMDRHHFENTSAPPLECKTDGVKNYPYNLKIASKIFQDVAKVSGGQLPTKVFAVSKGQRVCNTKKVLFPR